MDCYPLASSAYARNGESGVVPVRVTRCVVPVTAKDTAVPTVVSGTAEQEPRTSHGRSADNSPIFIMGDTFPLKPLYRSFLRTGRAARYQYEEPDV